MTRYVKGNKNCRPLRTLLGVEKYAKSWTLFIDNTLLRNCMSYDIQYTPGTIFIIDTTLMF